MRQTLPSTGELELRLTGQGTSWKVYLAVLMRTDASYLIPFVDRARVIAVRGRWLQNEGLEIIPRAAASSGWPPTAVRRSGGGASRAHKRLGRLLPCRAPQLAVTNERSQNLRKPNIFPRLTCLPHSFNTRSISSAH